MGTIVWDIEHLGRVKLDELSKILGFAGKPNDIDGSEVENYFRAGKIRRVTKPQTIDEPTSSEEEQRLLALVRDLDAFSAEFRVASKLNIFEAVGLQRQEIKHFNVAFAADIDTLMI